MSTIEISKDDVYEAIYDGQRIATESWRWGTTETYVYEREPGRFYRFTVQMHSQDGLQIFGPVTATEVRQVEKVVKVWEVVPTGGNADG